ncbi:HNH endonuclease [Paenibacillus macquariensis]|uniref:HNH endonuclease n=1 Tax=Paenibacillus macquariensis TaxID=948756 RepID=A0ABY1JK94_9BACL|nr:HNH endonuclease domain-containing protein [Paenibacillus macquariensis]MEC0089880.1 HNH endonuclease domain-containing protein [Paenibacillus macquariensis]OAB30658.1 HNH endonuclease [Paenibacillus macquariensis subsp. macquariensis]SIQ33382.1 HNH endonuclease [Paenibacillus macquariensis]
MTFLERWLHIVRSCSYVNTYNVAWAKAITEIAVESTFTLEKVETVEIQLKDIAKKVIRYYFEQTLFFDLQQSSNPQKIPVVVSIVKKLIDIYQVKTGSLMPIKWFKSNIETACKSEYEKAVSDTVKALKTDVSYRFLRIQGIEVEGVYQYEQRANSLFIRSDDLLALKENRLAILDAINYRWTQMLENFNHSPRLSKKVRIIDEDTMKRKPLGKFASFLYMENPHTQCFLCSLKIENETPAIDHVIPWSYLYSDDLWNLVFAHQSCNSSKSNVIPSEEMIQRLEERNKVLLQRMKEQGKLDKHVSELELAIESNFVRKFWIACQG